MEEQLILTAEDIEDISDDEMEELERLVEEYVEELQRHNDQVDSILKEINNTDAYKRLGIEIHVTTDYLYSVGEQ